MKNSDILSAMKRAVQAAMTYLRDEFLILQEGNENDSLNVMSKQDKAALPDFVTRLDTQAETIIHASLKSAFPHIAFVGEERGGDLSTSSFFLIDPLDGTKNMMALRDNFAVCAAFVKNGRVEAGVIGDPVRGHVVYAESGAGAWFENAEGAIKRLQNQDVLHDLKRVQLNAEIAFTTPQDFDLLARVMPHISTLRKSGSTAWDVIRLAQGRSDAIVSTGLEPHDIAPALVILPECGVTITDLNGTPAHLRTRNILAAAPFIHAPLMKHLQG